ncbi:hypothetical protein TWF679_008124 [Orbilia oligospora]|uniref:Uncharacterized protein n=1 Tax=Orbilia oligospora TaxID=2813651 RepID=A0A8H8VKQ2_ORBOL|nr:hypothetical protein TWF679_008124 [Orbilia oligospora]
MVRILLHALVSLFPSIVLSYYIAFSQKDADPAAIHVDRNHWYECYRLPSTREPLLGLSIYNAPSQTHFPDGIQFFADQSARCTGGPSLILTFSKRPGVYFVNLDKLGLSRVFTSWRYYDLQLNSLQLEALNNRSRRGGYAVGSIHDMAFKKRVKSPRWFEIKKLKDVPSSEGMGYPLNYLHEYGMPPTGSISEEKEKVIPWMEEQLRKWSNEPIEEDPQDVDEDADLRVQFTDRRNPQVGQNILTQNQRPMAFEGDMPPPIDPGMQKQYSLGSFEHMRQLAERPKKPTEALPSTKRMYEILKQNAQQKLKIPSPESAFGLESLKTGRTLPELLKEVEKLALDPESSDVELGWALTNLASLRDMSLIRREGGGVENFQVPFQGTEDAGKMGAQKTSPKKSALLDISNLSEVDDSTELKIIKGTEVPVVPIARNLGPSGAEPPHQGPGRTIERAYADNDDDAGPVEPYGRRRQTQSGITPFSPVLELQDRTRGQDGTGVTGRMEEEEKEVTGGANNGIEEREELIQQSLDLDPETEAQRAWEASLRDAGLEDIESLADSPDNEQPSTPEELYDMMEYDYLGRVVDTESFGSLHTRIKTDD